MKKLMLFTFLIILAIACNDNDSLSNENDNFNLTGEYIGTFERGESISNIELNISDETFEGNSGTVNLPAICKGEYSVSDNLIKFENQCVWTADFDWTLILNGEWVYTLDNNNLILTNDNGDKYILTKQ